MKKIVTTFLFVIGFFIMNVNAQFYSIEGFWQSNSGNIFYVKYSKNSYGNKTGLKITDMKTKDVSYPELIKSTLFVEKEWRTGTNYWTGSYSYKNEYYYKIINCFEIKVTTYTNGKFVRCNYWEKIY